MLSIHVHICARMPVCMSVYIHVFSRACVLVKISVCISASVSDKCTHSNTQGAPIRTHAYKHARARAHAGMRVVAGYSELQKAHQTQKARRKRMCCMLVTGCIVVAILLSWLLGPLFH